MPLYEYFCADCHTKTEALRPISKSDDPHQCRQCKSMHTSRAISVVAAVSRDRDGSSTSVAGTGGGCASCAGGNCTTCRH